MYSICCDVCGKEFKSKLKRKHLFQMYLNKLMVVKFKYYI